MSEYDDDERFHELVDTLVLGVASGEYPSLQFVRDALDYAETYFKRAAKQNEPAPDTALLPDDTA